MTSDDASRDLLNMIADVPVIFTWDGNEYEGTRGQLVKTDRLLDGGILTEPELSITTSLKKLNDSGTLEDRFPSNTPPVLGGTITSVGGVTGANYRIARLVEDEWASALQMDLISPHK